MDKPIIYRNKKESGVTLLLAILVLSSILAISFSIATIIFIEIRASGDLLRTERAIYGAQAVSEEVLFGARHHVPANLLTYDTHLGNSDVVMTSTTSLLSDPQVRDVVLTSSESLQNTVNRYSLYNVYAQDPTTAGSGYGIIKVTYLNTGNTERLEVYICEFDPNAVLSPAVCSDPNSIYWRYKDYLNPPGKPSAVWSINPGKQQELVLFNGASVPLQNISVLIEVFASDGVTPRGIPYFNQTVVDVNAANSGVNRSIRTIVPIY